MCVLGGRRAANHGDVAREHTCLVWFFICRCERSRGPKITDPSLRVTDAALISTDQERGKNRRRQRMFVKFLP